MERRVLPRRGGDAQGRRLVAEHGAHKQAEATDPLELVCAAAPGGNHEWLVRCLAEEYAGLGFGAGQILELFRSPGYAAPHGAYLALGEDTVRRLVEEVLGQCGVFRVSGTGQDGRP